MFFWEVKKSSRLLYRLPKKQQQNSCQEFGDKGGRTWNKVLASQKNIKRLFYQKGEYKMFNPVIVIETNFSNEISFCATRASWTFSRDDSVVSVFENEKSFRKTYPNALNLQTRTIVYIGQSLKFLMMKKNRNNKG